VDRKSPQEKKKLEYTKNHFTFGWQSSRMFPKTWKQRKTKVNRQYRRKSQELLAELKPGLSEHDLTSDDLTATRFQKSVSRKRLYKQGTVTVGEKVKAKLEKRTAIAGRRVQGKRECDRWARSAVTTLNGLQAKELADVARRAKALCTGNMDELLHVMSSHHPVDRALEFLRRVSFGSAPETSALRRSEELQQGLATWLKNAESVVVGSRHTEASGRSEGRETTFAPRHRSR
jgi:hypothetical protein